MEALANFNQFGLIELGREELICINRGGSTWEAVKATVGVVGATWAPIITGAAIVTGAAPLAAIGAGVAMFAASTKLAYDSISKLSKK